MTNPPENPNPVPPSPDPRRDSPTTAEVGPSRPVWYRRLPGRLGIWVAGLALVAACVIGCVGFIAGAVASHGFGEHGVSQDDRWGHERQRGDDGRGVHGDGENRAPQRQRGTTAPTPVPSGTVTPTPAQPSTPSPAATPTA